MDPARWQRLQALFAQALERPADEREAFVAAACGDDAALAVELRRLLAADARGAAGDAPLHAAVGAAAAGLLAQDRAALIGRRLGAWRIVAHIADGGMGAVYRAERADGRYVQTAALKLINPALVGPDAAARLAQERQILARLAHPNIARLLDGGETADGLPWLAMEFVEGQAIDAWCAARSPDTAARLRLMVQVCAAVDHAHRHLVVHRDLKPSNVLVDAEGLPHLLDFGIARPLQQDLALTRSGERLLTPSHASPEQVAGAAVTTATDVYALGVLLYELLLGRRPFDEHAGNAAALARAIVEQDPPRPSAVAAAAGRARLARELAGDLDNIVAMALRKEPGRRYASAQALAEDLTRHLAHRPVRARPDTARYRAAKFWRRHPVAVPATLLAGVLVLGGSAAFTWRLAEERDAARRAEVAAEQAGSFLERLFTGADPVAMRGERPSLEQLLEDGMARAERELAGSPLVLARTLHTLGRVRLNLGDYPGAEALLARALQIRRRELPPDDPAIVQTGAALGGALVALARHDEARPLLEAALAHERRRVPPDPQALAEALHDAAELDHQTGEIARAAQRIDEALSLLPRDGADNYREAVMLNAAGMVRSRAGDDAGARAAFERSLALHLAAGRTRDPGVAYAHANLATMLFPRGEIAEAERHFLAALAQLDARADGGGDVHQAVLATNLGRLYLETERLDEAQRWLLRAVELGRRALGEGHPQLSRFVVNLASLRRAQRRFDESASLLREAGAAVAAHPSLDAGFALVVGLESAWLALDRGDLAAAERLAREALQAMAAEPRLASQGRGARARALLGAALTRQGHLPEAGPLLQAAHDELAAARLPAQPLARWARERLAEWHERSGDHATAARLREGGA